MQNRIFSIDSPKAIKSLKFGWLNAIHYMAPHDIAGVGNLCPKATEGCKALCLGLWSGQAGMVSRNSNADQGNAVRASRKAKARRFMRERPQYMADIVRSIELAERKAARLGYPLCVRMNGSTDIAFEGIGCERKGQRYRSLMHAFPHLAFIDYTKVASRLKRSLPANYHLTLSRSEINEGECIEALQQGHNVAVVFKGARPATWQGRHMPSTPWAGTMPNLATTSEPSATAEKP